MNRLSVILAAVALSFSVLSGCAADGSSGPASSSVQSSAAEAQSSSEAAVSASSTSVVASSDASLAASSDVAGVASSDAVSAASSDAVSAASSDAASGPSSDAASSDARSSEPVLDGPSGLVETGVPMQYISMKEVLSNVEKGDKSKLLLDLRKAEDFKTGHIKGSVNAPLNKVVDNNNYSDGIINITSTLTRVVGNEIGEGRDIVLVCYAGKKYAQAATDILNALGADMDTVYTLEGGFTAWSEAGNPVVSG